MLGHMATTVENTPSYLHGWMAPVPDEIDATKLSVEGTLPSELDGRYLRNGSNPMPGVDPGHAFTGQGMLHGVRLQHGEATWYRNRWIKTPLLQGARPYRADGSRDLTASTANTSVLHYNEAVFALVENCLPFSVTLDLETIGPFDFHGMLKTPMTAHPKRDVMTGELHFFGYDVQPPFVTYHVASADGKLLRSEVIGVNGPTMMHDFALTEHHVVFLDLPVVFDMQLATQRKMPFRWSVDYPARLGVMPRSGGNADIRWIEVEPGYAFHIANAHEDSAGRILVEAVTYDERGFNTTWETLGGTSMLSGVHPLMPISGARFYAWQIDPKKNFSLVSDGALDDLDVEFPTINGERVARANRYTYAVTAPLEVDRIGGKIVKYDRVTGRRETQDLAAGWIPGEVTFVPARATGAEDDGYLISIVTHATADAAQLQVLSAAKLGRPPLAIVRLPRRVPAGFHGAWIPEPADGTEK